MIIVLCITLALVGGLVGYEVKTLLAERAERKAEDALDAYHRQLVAHGSCEFCRGELPMWECDMVWRTAQAQP